MIETVIKELYPELYRIKVICTFVLSDSLSISMLFFLFYSTKSYIQMGAVLNVIRALRSSQPPTIVRRRQTRVPRFVLSRDGAFAALNEEPRFCHCRRLRVNIDVSSSLRSSSHGMEMPVATAPRGHIHAHRQSSHPTPDTFSCAYCYDSHSRPSSTDSPLNTYSLLYSAFCFV